MLIECESIIRTKRHTTSCFWPAVREAGDHGRSHISVSISPRGVKNKEVWGADSFVKPSDFVQSGDASDNPAREAEDLTEKGPRLVRVR
jgi:hypothetical protein